MKNIFVIFTAFLAVVVVALLYTIARGTYADDSMYKALDKSNTRIQVNIK